MLFKTRYGEAIMKILSRYPQGSEPLVVALEILIQTAQSHVAQEGPEELAKKTCRGLHMDKPGGGVVCVKCFDAAFYKGQTDRAISGDELAAGKQGGSVAPFAVPEVGGKVDREAIEQEVARMLGAAGAAGGKG